MSRARRRHVRTLVANVSLSAVILGACTQYESGRTLSITPPPRDTFAPVSAVLEGHCGTLDCHGSPARNLRIYGVHGLRATGDSVTGSPDTTEQDIDATYESIVSVDPQSLGAVFAEGGREPERWLVTRKARGSESHKGGARLPIGSAGDRCLVAWVSGAEDGGDCATDVFGPEPKNGQTW
jgi:hypothetical protein